MVRPAGTFTSRAATRTRAAYACAVVATSLATSAGAAHAQPGRDALALVSAADTISVERFTRGATRLESELLVRAAGARLNFTVALDANGNALSIENAFRQATADPGSAPAQSALLTFRGDSVIAEIRGAAGSAPTTQRLATKPGALPYVNPSFALVELALARLLRAGKDTLVVPFFAVAGGATNDATLTRVGRDSVVVDFGTAAARLAVSPTGDILGGVIPSQQLRLVRLRGVTEGAMSAPEADYSAPAGAPYTAEDVTIPTKGGFTLAGTLTIPKGATGPVPAVVTITGSGAQDRDEAIPFVKGYRPFRQVADTLGRRGIAVLRMDDRGFGRSGGNVATATSADFADDVRAGLAYLRSRREIDPTHLGLVGHSEGGMIAPMVAAEDTSLRAIVLMAGPSVVGRRILEYQARSAIEHDTSVAPGKRDSVFAVRMRSTDSAMRVLPWLDFFARHDPLVLARRVKVPTLILQGGTDWQVTPEQAEQLAAAIREGGNRHVTVKVFPEANHLFVQDADGNPAGYAKLPGVVRSDVLGTLADWLVDQLRASR